MKELHLTSKPTSTLNKYLPQILIVGLILLVYIQNLWFDFVYLDDNYIILIEYNKINSLFKIPDAFINGYLFDNYYRPMIMTSFIIDAAIAGQSSSIYHLTNLLIHIGVCLLIFKLLFKITLNKNLALVLALFFSIHPLNVNAVSWIAGRNDLLLAFFSLLSILGFIKYVDNKKWIFLIFSMLMYLLAMYSKENGALIPIILISFIFLIKIGSKQKLKYLLVILSYLIPFFIYLTSRIFLSPVKISEETSFRYFLNNIYIPFEYLAKTFYFFNFSPLPIKSSKLVIGGLLSSIILLLIILLNKRINKKIFLFGLLIFIVFTVPPLFARIIINGDYDFYYYDSRAYLPLVGFLIILISILETIVTDKRIIIYFIVVFFVLSYSIISTLIFNNYYKNGKNFWGRATEVYPGQSNYWLGLGTYYFNIGNYNRAAQFGEKAISLNPNIEEYYYKTANAYTKKNDVYSAIKTLKKALEIKSKKSEILLNLMNLYFEVGDKINLEKTTQELLNLAIIQNRSDYISSASYFYFDKGQIVRAIEIMKISVAKNPLNPITLNDLGLMFYKSGDVKSAKEYFFKAMKLDPDNIKYLSNLKMCN